jgi:hypothetical protein
MGNSIDQKTKEEMIDELQNIYKYNCEILDLGERVGHSGYIDFITNEDLGTNITIMKGIDIYSRKFIVIKAKIIFNDDNQDIKEIDTFSTFFQRYHDSDTLWHCCGHYGLNLIETSGGMNLDQILFIKSLIYDGYYNLNLDILKKIRLNCYPNNIYFEDEIEINKCPIKVIIG